LNYTRVVASHFSVNEGQSESDYCLCERC